MRFNCNSKRKYWNEKLLWAATAGLLLSWGESSPAATYSPVMDSSVGKTPYQVLASAAGGFAAVAGWDNLSRSYRGKPPSFILMDGPPPRSHAAPIAGPPNAAYFYVYADQSFRGNPFQPVGYMGDRQDVRIDEKSTEDPADGLTCTKIVYSPKETSEQGWAGVYWLDPKSNWGYKPGGYNLSGMQRLTFWARGANGGEQIALFKVGGIGGTHADTGSAAIGPVWLTKEWQRYTIDLRDSDLSKVSGGFAWSTSRYDNVGPIAFYLDEIRYER